jgi:hypothetical protein
MTQADYNATIKAGFEARTTEELLAAVRGLGGGQLDYYGTITRGFCLDILDARIGADAVDAIMHEIGL